MTGQSTAQARDEIADRDEDVAMARLDAVGQSAG
jgi:hypothetical protein